MQIDQNVLPLKEEGLIISSVESIYTEYLTKKGKKSETRENANFENPQSAEKYSLKYTFVPDQFDDFEGRNSITFADSKEDFFFEFEDKACPYKSTIGSAERLDCNELVNLVNTGQPHPDISVLFPEEMSSARLKEQLKKHEAGVKQKNLKNVFIEQCTSAENKYFPIKNDINAKYSNSIHCTASKPQKDNGCSLENHSSYGGLSQEEVCRDSNGEQIDFAESNDPANFSNDSFFKNSFQNSYGISKNKRNTEQSLDVFLNNEVVNKTQKDNIQKSDAERIRKKYYNKKASPFKF